MVAPGGETTPCPVSAGEFLLVIKAHGFETSQLAVNHKASFLHTDLCSP